MSSKNIESGLTSINNHLVRMAQLAEIQINNAIEALITKNMALADEVASDGSSMICRRSLRSSN